MYSDLTTHPLSPTEKTIDGQPLNWVATWLDIGRNNRWIGSAVDPPFRPDSLVPCASVEELVEKVQGSNWVLGQGFYWRNICFIEQVNGGDEWLVIRESTAFESYTCGLMPPEDMAERIARIYYSTNQQCQRLRY